MRVSIIGSGRVGLSLGSLLAQSGFEVLMTDKNPVKRQDVRGESLSFYEPGLELCIRENRSRLKWTRYTEKVLSSDFIFLCLSAPVKKTGDLDLKDVFHWAELLAEYAKTEKLLIIKSTFPLGTNEKIQEFFLGAKAKIHVITCPEFLRQGHALKGLLEPDRLVIGAREFQIGKKLEEFYKKFSQPKSVIHTDPETAELSKLASNSFLAVKISFINEFAGLCDLVQADIKKLKQILGTDPRIGKDFLNPGLGYGGYCLPKDVQLSIQEGRKRNQSMDLLKSAQKINSSLVDFFFQKIKKRYKNLRNVPLAFWGISFKKDTEDLKNSPALDLLCRLLEAGAVLNVYDPLFVKEKVFCFFDKKAVGISSQFKPGAFTNRLLFQEDHVGFLRRKILAGKVSFQQRALDCLENRQGLIIGSDWEEFQKYSLLEIKKRLKQPFLVDGRSLFSEKKLKDAGFSFYQRGASFIQKKKNS